MCWTKGRRPWKSNQSAISADCVSRIGKFKKERRFYTKRSKMVRYNLNGLTAILKIVKFSIFVNNVVFTSTALTLRRNERCKNIMIKNIIEVMLYFSFNNK